MIVVKTAKDLRPGDRIVGTGAVRVVVRANICEDYVAIRYDAMLPGYPYGLRCDANVPVDTEYRVDEE